jgi:hypothetical protein
VRPEGDQGLRFIAARLMRDVLPRMGDAFGLADVAMTSSLLGAIATEYARAAETRMRDIEEMRSILHDGAQLPERVLAAACAEHAEMKPESLIIDELDRVHDRLSALLIELHAHVESPAGDQALNERIWAYLERHAERNAFESSF